MWRRRAYYTGKEDYAATYKPTENETLATQASLHWFPFSVFITTKDEAEKIGTFNVHELFWMLQFNGTENLLF